MMETKSRNLAMGLTIKQICKDYIGVTNYKADTKTLVEVIYRRYGLDLSRVSGLDLLHGSSTVPKLMSVIRRIQLTKKAVIKEVAKREAKAKAEES